MINSFLEQLLFLNPFQAVQRTSIKGKEPLSRAQKRRSGCAANPFWDNICNDFLEKLIFNKTRMNGFSTFNKQGRNAFLS
jgi:hypothetical protein